MSWRLHRECGCIITWQVVSEGVSGNRGGEYGQWVDKGWAVSGESRVWRVGMEACRAERK